MVSKVGNIWNEATSKGMCALTLNSGATNIKNNVRANTFNMVRESFNNKVQKLGTFSYEKFVYFDGIV